MLVGASYLALSDYVTVVPRLWLPVLMAISVAVLFIAQARDRYRLARAISFVLLGVVTVSLVLREVFLITTLSGRGAPAYSVLVEAVLIWGSTVVTFAPWYWEIDGDGPAERTTQTHASEDLLFPQMDQGDGERAIGWAPGFLDYLFVAFTLAIAVRRRG